MWQYALAGKTKQSVIKDQLKLLYFISTNIVKTQRNSTQLKATQKQLRWVRHSTHVFPTTPPPQQIFQALLDQLRAEIWHRHSQDQPD